MRDQSIQTEDVIYPSIVFRVKNGLYCVNSKYIETLMQLPHYEELPDAPANIIGIFKYRESVIQMFDLRTAFGMPTLRDEYQQFADMIDARKQGHIDWVNELERCLETGERFKLATDPHQCAFGKWYDSFESDNSAIMAHLRKIEEPHARLHNAALEVTQCKQNCGDCERAECLKSVLERVKGEDMPRILKLLEEAKEIFKDRVFHEMVLVLSNGTQTGLIADEILSVEDLSDVGDQEAISAVESAEHSCVVSVKQSAKIKGLILELNVERLIPRRQAMVALEA